MRIPPTVFCSSLWAVLSTTVLLFYCIAHVGQCHSRNNKKKQKRSKQTTEACVCMCVLQLFFIPLLSRSEQSHFYSTQSPRPPRPALPAAPPPPNKYYILSVVSVWSRTARPTRFHRHGGGGRRRRREGETQVCIAEHVGGEGGEGGVGGWQIKTAKIEKTTTKE